MVDRPPKNFPLTDWRTDDRFTIGLVLDVAAVLSRHGYPPLSGGGDDHTALGQALFRFLYAPDSSTPDGPRPSGKD